MWSYARLRRQGFIQVKSLNWSSVSLCVSQVTENDWISSVTERVTLMNKQLTKTELTDIRMHWWQSCRIPPSRMSAIGRDWVRERVLGMEELSGVGA